MGVVHFCSFRHIYSFKICVVMIKKLWQTLKTPKVQHSSDEQIEKLKQGLKDIELLIEESLEEEQSINLKREVDEG